MSTNKFTCHYNHEHMIYMVELFNDYVVENYKKKTLRNQLKQAGIALFPFLPLISKSFVFIVL